MTNPFEKLMRSWSQLPYFVRNNRYYKVQTLMDDSGMAVKNYPDIGRAVPFHEANLISSSEDNLTHRVMLDIDFEAALIPSSTPGHYHLYLNHLMTSTEYAELLKVLAKLRIIQPGFYYSFLQNGVTTLRLPHIKKGE